jgi:hypothetical protein
MTQAEYARHRGVTKPAVSNWKKQGLLVLAEDPSDARIKVDVARTDAKLNAKIDPMRGRPPAGAAEPAPALPLEGGAAPVPASPAASAGEGTVTDERVLHLREQRIGQAMKNAQTARELVPLVEAERRVSEIGRAARERMQAWLRSSAERFAAEKDVRQIMAIGEAGIDEVFAELADAALRGDFAGDEEADLTAEEQAELAEISADE